MKKKMKQFLTGILCMMLAIMMVPQICEPVYASGEVIRQETKAAASYKKLYKKFLEKGTVKNSLGYSIPIEWYRVLNINRSGVPELIVMGTSGAMHTYYVYTVKNGKIIKCGECSIRGLSNQPVVTYVKKYKGIVTSGWTNGVGGAWSTMFCLSKYKLVQKHHARSWQNPKGYWTGTTDTKCKKVSKSKFNKYVEKYFGKSKTKTYKMLSNTATNRKKSFK